MVRYRLLAQIFLDSWSKFRSITWNSLLIFWFRFQKQMRLSVVSTSQTNIHSSNVVAPFRDAAPRLCSARFWRTRCTPLGIVRRRFWISRKTSMNRSALRSGAEVVGSVNYSLDVQFCKLFRNCLNLQSLNNKNLQSCRYSRQPYRRKNEINSS